MIKSKEFAVVSLSMLVAISFVLVFQGYKVKTQSTSIAYYNEIAITGSKTIPVSAEKTIAKPVVKNHAISKELAKTSPQVLPTPLPIVPPQILNSVMPTYPEAALKNGIEGFSIVEAKIGIDGSAKNVAIKTSSGNIDLDNSALIAVADWKFVPAAQGGQSIASAFEVPVKFIINDK
ncbi:hypothetical protein A3J90_01490 [candidate division WOR-1 bacterium RIFOXYC2_FULL_37_10]|uniref:TonB C-terminal domain-containing protein n=1 Tax=candidate division WOR-1 bacterium RIFOXYB2_FULL_37_13 TaxID=1802579 RepID=A0A1F4SF12_UNCSA|nr:MAG: hypothetical protein A2246_04720 [candidate division WOR-1 bacterium RIFOXYA2_FULL_37_7]OGC18989.1 MAG: hypothetical protein A2310_06365 [candidate division WOR-1 bacterium RIFOXYB2_FULL_37_13]OGC35785.1 MAG: hypothetical protein A3J90_01490 [candidate division WOR-1 bacterium RIFOXYC2_FULL_37_10]